MQDMGRVELEDIYKKLKDSLSKKDKTQQGSVKNFKLFKMIEP